MKIKCFNSVLNKYKSLLTSLNSCKQYSELLSQNYLNNDIKDNFTNINSYDDREVVIKVKNNEFILSNEASLYELESGESNSNQNHNNKDLIHDQKYIQKYQIKHQIKKVLKNVKICTKFDQKLKMLFVYNSSNNFYNETNFKEAFLNQIFLENNFILNTPLQDQNKDMNASSDIKNQNEVNMGFQSESLKLKLNLEIQNSDLKICIERNLFENVSLNLENSNVELINDYQNSFLSIESENSEIKAQYLNNLTFNIKSKNDNLNINVLDIKSNSILTTSESNLKYFYLNFWSILKYNIYIVDKNNINESSMNKTEYWEKLLFIDREGYSFCPTLVVNLNDNTSKPANIKEKDTRFLKRNYLKYSSIDSKEFYSSYIKFLEDIFEKGHEKNEFKFKFFNSSLISLLGFWLIFMSLYYATLLNDDHNLNSYDTYNIGFYENEKENIFQLHTNAKLSQLKIDKFLFEEYTPDYKSNIIFKNPKI